MSSPAPLLGLERHMVSIQAARLCLVVAACSSRSKHGQSASQLSTKMTQDSLAALPHCRAVVFLLHLKHIIVVSSCRTLCLPCHNAGGNVSCFVASMGPPRIPARWGYIFTAHTYVLYLKLPNQASEPLSPTVARDGWVPPL